MQRRTRSEYPGHTHLREDRHVGVGDDAPDHEDNVLTTLGAQQLRDTRHQHEVRARKQRESECVGVLLDDRVDNLLGSLVQAGVDHFEARVAQGTSDDFGATIMTVETGFGDHYSVGALHNHLSYVRSQPLQSRGHFGGRVALNVVRTPGSPRGVVRALASAMRIPQWVKNGLLVVAPGASGTLFHRTVLANTMVAFAAFCCVASSLYVLNDVRDLESDRQHPTKQFRAIASGHLSRGRALALSAVLITVGLLLPILIRHPSGFYLILALYIAETLAYILWLKNAVIIELGLVASGFFLRSYGGAVASHIPVSTWFLIVVTFGALFLVVGKRSAELSHVGTTNRAVLQEYTAEFLHSALTLSATVVVTAYCLWAIDTSSTGLSSIKHDIIPVRLSMVPVVLAMLFIMRGAESGSGESPEDLLLKNRMVQFLAVLWAGLIYWATYG